MPQLHFHIKWYISNFSANKKEHLTMATEERNEKPLLQQDQQARLTSNSHSRLDCETIFSAVNAED